MPRVPILVLANFVPLAPMSIYRGRLRVHSLTTPQEILALILFDLLQFSSLLVTHNIADDNVLLGVFDGGGSTMALWNHLRGPSDPISLRRRLLNLPREIILGHCLRLVL